MKSSSHEIQLPLDDPTLIPKEYGLDATQEELIRGNDADIAAETARELQREADFQREQDEAQRLQEERDRIYLNDLKPEHTDHIAEK